ncbi:MAG: hypothetical protein EZS28_040124 [Streblomastix strix]|uniref:Uncharacterized protein n=1 Tax=Streblomastix strix TaxID=222440 RepID=A0A5J4U229_9EUKA|nr:MAG: hypothetical protein EZS28_040124 [Streblomastix strix]
MDSRRCISLMERLTKRGQSKSVVRTAEGQEEYLESRQILGRVASGAQRGYSDGSELPGCDSFQPVLYGPEAGKQMEKDPGLQSSQQSNYKYPLQDGRFQYCNTSSEISRLYNSYGFGECLSPHQIEPRTSEIHGIQVHGQGLCIRRNAHWLESFSTAALKDNEIDST